MELLIPGLILVALMVWASTRIKKTAAAAWDEETIVGDGFSIVKPEGFLNVIGGDPQFLFEAYSKEFSKEQPDLRCGSVTIERIDDRPIEEIAEELRSNRFVDLGDQVIGGHRYRELSIESNIETNYFVTLGEANGSVYKLHIVASQESQGKWVETFSDTFRAK